MAKDFYAAIKDRRTRYAISKESTVSDERIQEVVKHALLHAPSAFNNQGARVVVLFGENHNKFWDETKEILRKITPEEQFRTSTEGRINSFRGGYGTVLFFDDTAVTEAMQKNFPFFKDQFPVWAQQANGMLQYIVWSSLEIEGLGASLQHYAPLVDDMVRKNWNVPETWKLIAQMPFGKPVASPDEKQFNPLEERFKVFK